MFPALKPAGPFTRIGRRWGRRLLPVWLLVGLALILIGLLAVLLSHSARVPSAAPTPGPSQPSTALDGVGAGAAVDPSSRATGAGAGASAARGPSASATATGTVTPMRISNLASTNNLTSWDVVVTIENPADIDQTWTNVSVQIPETSPLGLVALTPNTTVYDDGRTVCVEPTSPSPVAPRSTVDIKFRVNAVLSEQPRLAQLDNPACVPPGQT
jgi:hypothetical protein